MYIYVALVLAIGLALFILVPRILPLINKGYIGDVILADNQLVYTFNISNRDRGTGDYRVTKIGTLNTETGALKTRILYGGISEIKLIADGKIWTGSVPEEHTNDVQIFKINVLDQVTLKSVYDTRSIQQLIQIKKGERLARMEVYQGSTKIIFVSNSGSHYAIDSSETQFRIPAKTKFISSSSIFKASDWREPYSVKTTSDPARHSISLHYKSIGTESFIRPIWFHAFHSEGVNGVVFVHAQTVDPRAYVSLTLLAQDGKVIWSVKQQSLGLGLMAKEHEVQSFTFFGANKDLLIYQNDRKIFAVNAAHGEIMWVKSL